MYYNRVVRFLTREKVPERPRTRAYTQRGGQPEVASFRWQIIKGVLRLFGIAALIAATYYLTRLAPVTLVGVSVVGGETISHEMVREQVRGELEGTYFRIVPRAFAYLYPHDRIVEVLEKNERMHNTAVERVSRTELAVTFDEYIPHALWCPDGTPDTRCYFMSADGFAFEEAPPLHGGTFVRHISEGATEVSRGTAIESGKLKSVDAFIARVEEELVFRIASVVYTKAGDIQFFINGGGMILVSGTDDLMESLTNVISVFSSSEFKHIEPGNFKYIDVRFAPKIFVNEELTPVSTTTASTTDVVIEAPTSTKKLPE